jgi:hypothetical protein
MIDEHDHSPTWTVSGVRSKQVTNSTFNNARHDVQQCKQGETSSGTVLRSSGAWRRLQLSKRGNAHLGARPT